MKKTSVYLEDEQAERLEELSKASGIPPSVLIRRFVELAMDAVLAQKKDFNFNVLMELDAVKRAIEKKRRE